MAPTALQEAGLPQKAGLIIAILLALAMMIALAHHLLARESPAPPADEAGAATHLHVATATFSVTINAAPDAPLVDTGRRDRSGDPVMVACGTCHATREPTLATSSAAELDEFHQGLAFDHGERSCLSCHDAANMDGLRLADGTHLSFASVMQLCAQCHGPQARDYSHGAHGGMNGYWDLTRGPRRRNVCTDCHDPHAPAFPSMIPAPRSRDRFLDADADHGVDHE